MGRTSTTRAGETGAIDTDKLKASTNGFGVFAYYTGTTDYASNATEEKTDGSSVQTSMAANFMFNQQVIYKSERESQGFITAWYYSPAKYWPNEVQNGAVDDQDNDTGNDPATSTNTKGGKVSFFAYAPYVELSSTAITTTDGGITAINGKTTLSEANGIKTDPIITYVVPSTYDKFVDLLWGTYKGTSENVLGTAQAGVSYKTDGNSYEQSILPHQISTTPTYDGYTVNANLTKQKTNGTIGFYFRHALAKVGGSEDDSNLTGTTHGLMVVADIDDQRGAETGGALSSATKITITDVQIEARALYDADSDGELEADEYLTAMEGDLNLATGRWKVKTGGNTGTSPATANATHNITSPASSSGITSSAELNENIAEPQTTSTSWSTIPTGVTTTPQNVYKGAATPLVFIPGTYPELTVTIHYTVRSSDNNLAESVGKDGEGKWTYVEQIIKKRVKFTNPVELNKQYSLLMHLGLTSVKFTASVSDWEVAGDTNVNGTIDGEEKLVIEDIHLPINVGQKKYTFTSYKAETGDDTWTTGMAELTGETTTINGETYQKVKVIYQNDYQNQIGTEYWIPASASSSARVQLYTTADTPAASSVWVAIAPFVPMTYSFTSYSAASDGTQYSTGTAQTTGNYKEISNAWYQQIVVLTNPNYTEWVGKTFYVPVNATTGNTRYQLHSEQGTTIDVWVAITN